MPRLIPFLFSFGSIRTLLSGRIYVGVLPRREPRAEKRGGVIVCHLSGSSVTVCLSVALPIARSLPLPASQFYLPPASLFFVSVP